MIKAESDKPAGCGLCCVLQKDTTLLKRCQEPEMRSILCTNPQHRLLAAAGILPYNHCDMNIKREQIAEVLLSAGIVAVGFATGNPVISGIGVNWAADLTQAGWGQACRRLLGESGLLNQDLQQAVARAFQQAIAHLEQSWWQTPRGNQMLHNKPEADLAREAFKMLREDAGRFCTPDHLGRVAGNEQVSLAQREEARRAALERAAQEEAATGRSLGLRAWVEGMLE